MPTKWDIDLLKKKLQRYPVQRFLDRNERKERVALLTAHGVVHEVKNMHPNSERHFRINNGQVHEALRESNDKLWAVMHTHPFRSSKYPSDDDLDGCPIGLFGVVLHVASGRMTLYCTGEEILHINKPRLRS